MSRQQKKNVFSLIFFYGFILLFNIALLLFIFPTIFVDESKVGIYYFFAMMSVVISGGTNRLSATVSCASIWHHTVGQYAAE